MITNKSLEALQYASRNFSIKTEALSPTSFILTVFNNHKREPLEARKVESEVGYDLPITTLLHEFEELKTKHIFDYDKNFPL